MAVDPPCPFIQFQRTILVFDCTRRTLKDEHMQISTADYRHHSQPLAAQCEVSDI